MTSTDKDDYDALIYATLVNPSKSSETNIKLLLHSIRTFAGRLSRNQLWCYSPSSEDKFSEDFIGKISKMGGIMIPFEMEEKVRRFPFTSHAFAAALAESRAYGQYELLAWVNPNTVFLKEPKDFLLPKKKCLGYRPVHHTLIGSHFEESLDPFWTLIYRYCKVPDDRVFPMTTHVDDKILRPYFNSGILITRPNKRLFCAWWDTFFKIYKDTSLQLLYEKDERYRIFIHQAVLSGIILSVFETNEIQELPPEYNYPIHLWGEDISKNRPSSIDKLVTIRHEGFDEAPDLIEKLNVRALNRWLAKHVLAWQ